jgi:hypothetical protein
MIIPKNYIKAKIAEKKREMFNYLSSCKLKVFAVGRLTTPELIDKAVNFCELYSGVLYFPYQELFARRLVRSILNNDGEEITALFARQSGN